MIGRDTCMKMHKATLANKEEDSKEEQKEVQEIGEAEVGQEQIPHLSKKMSLVKDKNAELLSFIKDEDFFNLDEPKFRSKTSIKRNNSDGDLMTYELVEKKDTGISKEEWRRLLKEKKFDIKSDERLLERVVYDLKFQKNRDNESRKLSWLLVLGIDPEVDDSRTEMFYRRFTKYVPEDKRKMEIF